LPEQDRNDPSHGLTLSSLPVSPKLGSNKRSYRLGSAGLAKDTCDRPGCTASPSTGRSGSDLSLLPGHSGRDLPGPLESWTGDLFATCCGSGEAMDEMLCEEESSNHLEGVGSVPTNRAPNGRVDQKEGDGDGDNAEGTRGSGDSGRGSGKLEVDCAEVGEKAVLAQRLRTSWDKGGAARGKKLDLRGGGRMEGTKRGRSPIGQGRVRTEVSGSVVCPSNIAVETSNAEEGLTQTRWV
jgi:hypothetical protein